MSNIWERLFFFFKFSIILERLKRFQVVARHADREHGCESGGIAFVGTVAGRRADQGRGITQFESDGEDAQPLCIPHGAAGGQDSFSFPIKIGVRDLAHFKILSSLLTSL